MNKTKLRKGFTLIEVVIVLAIAALIMVGVFIAVQGAQRAQRDNARKNLVNQVSAAAQAYAGNHNGDQAPNAKALEGYVASTSVQGINIELKADDSAITNCKSDTHVTIWLSPASDGSGNKVANICLESGDQYTGNTTVTSTTVSTSPAGP